MVRLAVMGHDDRGHPAFAQSFTTSLHPALALAGRGLGRRAGWVHEHHVRFCHRQTCYSETVKSFPRRTRESHLDRLRDKFPVEAGGYRLQLY